MLAQAPLGLRILLLVLLCGSCMTGLTGAISGSPLLLMIAGGAVSLAVIIILVWRLQHSPENDTQSE